MEICTDSNKFASLVLRDSYSRKYEQASAHLVGDSVWFHVPGSGSFRADYSAKDAATALNALNNYHGASQVQPV